MNLMALFWLIDFVSEKPCKIGLFLNQFETIKVEIGLKW